MSVLFKQELKKNHRIVREYEGSFGDYWKKDADKNIKKFNDVIVLNGIARWNSNKQVPPSDLLTLWYMAGCEFDFDKTINEKDKEQEIFLEAYRESRKNYKPSDEELFEMKCAFREGTVVVDVITGQKTQL